MVRKEKSIMSRNNSRNKTNSTPKGGNKPKTNGHRGTSVDEKNAKDFNASFTKIEANGAPNDPDDYFTDLQLAEQATNVSIPQFLGHSPYMDKIDLPTVEIINVNPSIGVSDRDAEGKVSFSQSGAWMASQKLYTLLSINSGRTANYQQNDVLAAVVALGQTVSLVEYCRRFFGVATTYSLRNRAYAVRLLSMLASANTSGRDDNSFGEDFIANAANYRMRLNMLITKINQLPIIANMGYLRRCIRMFQSIYVDTESSMSQTYAFAPYSLWKLEENMSGETRTGSTLKTVPLVSTSAVPTFADFLNALSAMIDALLNSTTLNYVYADILNYASKYSMTFFTLDYVTEGYAVVPVLEPRMNEIVHNTMFVGHPMTLIERFSDYQTNENDVTLDVTSGSIKYAPFFGAESVTGTIARTTFADAKHIPIDFATSNPDLTSRVDAYRLKFAPRMMMIQDPGTTNSIFVALIAGALPDWYPVQALIYGVDANQFVRYSSHFSRSGNSVSLSTNYRDSARNNRGTHFYDTTDRISPQPVFNAAAILTYQSELINAIAPTSWDWRCISDGQIDYLSYQDFERFVLMFDLEAQGLLDFRMK